MNVKENTDIRTFKLIRIKTHNINVYPVLKKIKMGQPRNNLPKIKIEERVERDRIRLLEAIHIDQNLR